MFKFLLYLFWFSTYFELNVEREKKVAKQYIKEEIFSRSTFNSKQVENQNRQSQTLNTKNDPDKIAHIPIYMWTLNPEPKALKKATEKLGILPCLA